VLLPKAERQLSDEPHAPALSEIFPPAACSIAFRQTVILYLSKSWHEAPTTTQREDARFAASAAPLAGL